MREHSTDLGIGGVVLRCDERGIAFIIDGEVRGYCSRDEILEAVTPPEPLEDEEFLEILRDSDRMEQALRALARRLHADAEAAHIIASLKKAGEFDERIAGAIRGGRD